MHAQGGKPWEPPPEPGSSLSGRLRAYAELIHQDTPPYTAEARHYRGLPGQETPWMEPRTLIGRVMSRIFPGQPAMEEPPFAITDSAARRAARVVRRWS